MKTRIASASSLQEDMRARIYRKAGTAGPDETESLPHPIQPLGFDADGRPRFKENKIVRFLLDYATDRGFGLNEISMARYSVEDMEQFVQLIGYSLSGFSELSYVREKTLKKAEARWRRRTRT